MWISFARGRELEAELNSCRTLAIAPTSHPWSLDSAEEQHQGKQRCRNEIEFSNLTVWEKHKHFSPKQQIPAGTHYSISGTHPSQPSAYEISSKSVLLPDPSSPPMRGTSRFLIKHRTVYGIPTVAEQRIMDSIMSSLSPEQSVHSQTQSESSEREDRVEISPSAGPEIARLSCDNCRKRKVPSPFPYLLEHHIDLERLNAIVLCQYALSARS